MLINISVGAGIVLNWRSREENKLDDYEQAADVCLVFDIA